MSRVDVGKYETALNGGIWTLFGKSTYTKPLPEKDDEFFGGRPLFIYEEDTQNNYKYNYDDKEWIFQGNKPYNPRVGRSILKAMKGFTS